MIKEALERGLCRGKSVVKFLKMLVKGQGDGIQRSEATHT